MLEYWTKTETYYKVTMTLNKKKKKKKVKNHTVTLFQRTLKYIIESSKSQ